jgi:serine/threonine protein kinase
MLQMSSAMEYIHMQGIVHRDIKADNILLAHPEGDGPLCVKVADFGVATVLSTVAGSAALLSNRGTEVYYAPERGNQQAYGAKADMWALGMMLTELVTLSQINKGLWHSGSEVSERRGKVLQQVATRTRHWESWPRICCTWTRTAASVLRRYTRSSVSLSGPEKQTHHQPVARRQRRPETTASSTSRTSLPSL